MFSELYIRNFKSVIDEKIELSTINVFIGENGCGKSNILEAVAFASASAESVKIDTESLYSKGIRVAKPKLFLSSFFGKEQAQKIIISLKSENDSLRYELEPENTEDVFSKWVNTSTASNIINSFTDIDESEFPEFIKEALEQFKSSVNNLNQNRRSISNEKYIEGFELFLNNALKKTLSVKPIIDSLKDYLIYSVNTNTLRGVPAFQDSHKEPLGINGENLDILIANLDQDELMKLKEYIYLVSWMEDFTIDKDDMLKNKGFKLNRTNSLLYFTDRFMMRKNNIFSSENANEGILHLLFYFSLIISKKTPRFFAIDNIESSLNPHLCREIMKQICKIAKIENKQILITTHNPAILDGLNVNDDQIRLFEVYRNDSGHTKTKRITFKGGVKTENSKLSELWMKGYLGAISKKF